MSSHAVVIVLGDTGRSPRMQYHAVSLAGLDEFSRVTLIGYTGEACTVVVTDNPKIHDVRLDTTFKSIEFIRVVPLLHAVLKGLLLTFSLLLLLLRLPHITLVLIQNPPATPVAVAARLLSICTGAVVCVDWHNLGYTLYLDRYKPTHPLVRLSWWLEKTLLSPCHEHLCVSRAMGRWLQDSFGVQHAHVFYDRPPRSVFSRFTENSCRSDKDGVTGEESVLIGNKQRVEGEMSRTGDGEEGEVRGRGSQPLKMPLCPPPQVPLEDRHRLLCKLNLTEDKLFPHSAIPPQFSSLRSPSPSKTPDPVYHRQYVPTPDMFAECQQTHERTIQTYRLVGNSEGGECSPAGAGQGEVCMRSDRAVILLSSTSWTPDEDFSLLARALLNLDRSLVKRRAEGRSAARTRVVVVVTGKGPMRNAFMQDWESRQRTAGRLVYVALVCVWLEAQDYPLMVACADMGICLHTSSSGLDLPMKVLDMFGSGVPVCAVSYPALPELVKNGENGIVFRSHAELAAHLYRLFCDSPNEKRSAEELLKMRTNAFNIGTWETAWTVTVRPLILQAIVTHKQCRSKSLWFNITYRLILIATVGVWAAVIVGGVKWTFSSRGSALV